jgi:hypothetical protein
MATVWAKMNHNMDVTNGIFKARHSEDFWKATAANICVICIPAILLVTATEMIFKNGAILVYNAGVTIANAASDLHYRAIQRLYPTKQKKEEPLPLPPPVQKMEDPKPIIPIANPVASPVVNRVVNSVPQPPQIVLTIPISSNVHYYWEHYFVSSISTIWQAPGFGTAWNWVASIFTKEKED